MREAGILEVLLLRAGRAVTKEQLMEGLCAWDSDISLNAIEVYVHRLRKKLEPAGIQVRTFRGLGYCIDKPVGNGTDKPINGHDGRRAPLPARNESCRAAAAGMAARAPAVDLAGESGHLVHECPHHRRHCSRRRPERGIGDADVGVGTACHHAA